MTDDKYFKLVDHAISVATTQLRHYSTKLVHLVLEHFDLYFKTLFKAQDKCC